jgi:hypothetical protein
MPIAVVQHVNNLTAGSGTTEAVTVASTGAGNLLVAMTLTTTSASVTGVSDGTNGFQQFPAALLAGTGGFATLMVDVWFLPRSASGKTVITATFSPSSSERALEVWEVSGFTNPVPDGTNGNSNDAGSAGSVDTGMPVTTTAPGFVVAYCGETNTVTLNPDTGNEFSAGGDLSAPGQAWCSLISLAGGVHTPAWHSNTASSAFLTFTAAFRETYVARTMDDSRPFPLLPGSAPRRF